MLPCSTIEIMILSVMALFDGQISQVNKDVTEQVSGLQSAESKVLSDAIDKMYKMITSILTDYTVNIEVRAVKK